MTYLLSFVFGFIIGLPMGGLGGGGGVLLFPLLVYGLGLPPKVAIAHSIVIVGFTCFFAFTIYCREGAFRAKEAAVLAVFGALGAQVGAYVCKLLPEYVILCSACILLFAVAFMMLRSAAVEAEFEEKAIQHLGIYVPIGLLVGFVTGFLGVGGGFLLVPVCIMVGGMSVATAAGTALLVGLLNSISGHFAHRSVALDLGIVLTFLIASCLSSVLARRWARNVADAVLKRTFAILLGVIALGMLIDASLQMVHG